MISPQLEALFMNRKATIFGLCFALGTSALAVSLKAADTNQGSIISAKEAQAAGSDMRSDTFRDGALPREEYKTVGDLEREPLPSTDAVQGGRWR